MRGDIQDTNILGIGTFMHKRREIICAKFATDTRLMGKTIMGGLLIKVQK